MTGDAGSMPAGGLDDDRGACCGEVREYGDPSMECETCIRCRVREAGAAAFSDEELHDRLAEALRADECNDTVNELIETFEGVVQSLHSVRKADCYDKRQHLVELAVCEAMDAVTLLREIVIDRDEELWGCDCRVCQSVASNMEHEAT